MVCFKGFDYCMSIPLLAVNMCSFRSVFVYRPFVTGRALWSLGCVLCTFICPLCFH